MSFLGRLPLPSLGERVAALDWRGIETELDARGCAVIDGLITVEEARGISSLYPDDSAFRSRDRLQIFEFREGVEIDLELRQVANFATPSTGSELQRDGFILETGAER